MKHPRAVPESLKRQARDRLRRRCEASAKLGCDVIAVKIATLLTLLDKIDEAEQPKPQDRQAQAAAMDRQTADGGGLDRDPARCAAPAETSAKPVGVSDKRETEQ